MQTTPTLSLFILFLNVPAALLAQKHEHDDLIDERKSVYFPQFQRFQSVKNEMEMLYKINGKLTLVDECLRMESGNRSFLLIWPGWYEFETNGREIIVQHLQSKTIVSTFKTGDSITCSGAEIENNPINLQYAVPTQCPGPFWAVGEIESVAKTSQLKFHQAHKQRSKSVKKASPSVSKSALSADEGSAPSSKALIRYQIKLEDSLVKQ